MPNIEVMSPAAAKARLLELDHPKHPRGLTGSLWASPTVRAAALLLGAAALGTTVGSRSRSGTMRSLRRVATRAATVVGPLVAQQIARELVAPRGNR